MDHRRAHPTAKPQPEAKASPEIAEDRQPNYQVGYGRPPVHSRFKPGVSGNPKGRPKPIKVRNIKKDVQQVFLRELAVRDGHKTRRVSGIVLLYQKLLSDALKGDTRAALAAYKLASECGVLAIHDVVEVDHSILTPEEREICRKATEILVKAQVIPRAR
jgi:hypothetical protein